MAFDLYIFDLDGTLIDTRQDITTAINAMLDHYGLATRSVEEVTGFVGDGIKKLVQRCMDKSRVSLDEAILFFKDAYWDHMLDTTKPYPGVVDLLTRLQGKQKAILTNKAFKFTKAILDGLGLTKLFPLIVGGDTVERKKPFTEGIESILRKTGRSKDRSVMIGDGRNDILVAKKAGVTSVYVTYGFTTFNRLDGIIPDYVMDSPMEILEIG
jgi:phosphoglycolate phosphatase